MQKLVYPDWVAISRIKPQSRYADHAGENPDHAVDDIALEELATRVQYEILP
jgi:hypothetical protein